MLLTSVFRVLLTRSFKPFVLEGAYQGQLDFKALDDLGLYVHIPFCRSLCSFCPYCKVIYDQETADAYKSALLKEIDLVGAAVEGAKEVDSLYFGGGTPALMIDDLADIICRLKQYFVITGGVGVELHPRDICEANLQKLTAAGVNMISIGIQSFDQNCLRKLGRNYDLFTDRLQLANTYGFDVVDVDLIFAIPGQTEETLIRDIQTAFENGATQVSTYPFIDFTFAHNHYKPMPERVKKKMLQTLSEYCQRHNIERTSVWTFAKPGTDKYSSVTRDSFLGFGVSATTLLKDTFKINTFSIESYIDRIDSNSLPTSLTINFSQRQRAAYFLFWAAYSMRLDPVKFEKIVGMPLGKMFGMELLIAEKKGYISKTGSTFELTERGAALYHQIEQVYTSAYIDKMWNVSRRQAFPDRIVLK